MAVIVLPFKCPSCGTVFYESGRVRWKEVGDIQLYACLECQEKGMTEDQLLRVAIIAGWDAARYEQQRCDRLFKEPEIPNTPFLKWKDGEQGEFGEWV